MLGKDEDKVENMWLYDPWLCNNNNIIAIKTINPKVLFSKGIGVSLSQDEEGELKFSDPKLPNSKAPVKLIELYVWLLYKSIRKLWHLFQYEQVAHATFMPRL